MIDSKIEQYLRPLISQWALQNKPFTSLDVANAAKRAGHDVRNREVANWLRTNAIQITTHIGATYNQTLIKVNSKSAGITMAYLYHDCNIDPDTYLDRDQNPAARITSSPNRAPYSSSTTITMTPKVSLPQTPPKKQGHWVNQKRDALGRFC